MYMAISNYDILNDNKDAGNKWIKKDTHKNVTWIKMEIILKIWNPHQGGCAWKRPYLSIMTAHDLQSFRVFSYHPNWVYCAGKPLKSMVYCFYTLTVENVCERQRNWFLISRSSCSFSAHLSDDAVTQSQLLKGWNGSLVPHTKSTDKRDASNFEYYNLLKSKERKKAIGRREMYSII